MSFYTTEELHELGFKSVAENVRISRKASIYGTSRIEIGAHSRIDDFCVLSAGEGGISIGRNVHIAVMSIIIGVGKVEIHDFCNLSSRVSVYSSSDDYSGEYMTNPTIPEKYTNVDVRDVSLERHVIVGSGSVILPGVTIGEGTAVGAACLVRKSLEPFGIYGGSPFKRLKNRSRRLLKLEREYLNDGRELD